MAEPRFPTMDEFWKRLELRELEPDLKQELRARLDRETGTVSRAGSEDLVVAVASRMIPGDVPAKALAVVLDQSFDQQGGRADEKLGLMPRGELIPTGFKLLDDEARKRHGASFADLDAGLQDELLSEAEKGNLKGPERFDSATWFKRMRESLLSAFGSDPRGMVQMGYPGPPYKPGHVWLTAGGVQARANRKKGYLEF